MPYPIPSGAAIEGGPEQRRRPARDPATTRPRCRSYELYAAYPNGDGSWRAGSGAVFDLRGNALRPAGLDLGRRGRAVRSWPGWCATTRWPPGRIDHAIRVTAPRTRNAYVWPARHAASSATDAALPPMGLRLRLKSSVDISRLPAQARVVAEAMQRYGVILADNGSAWYISGAPDDRWNNDALHALGALKGSDFEAVDTSSLMVSPDSAQCPPSLVGGAVPEVDVALGGELVDLGQLVVGEVEVRRARPGSRRVARRCWHR